MTGRLNSAQPYAIGLFRIVVGLLFACHGAASLFGVLGGAGGNGATVETGAWPNWYAAVIELVGGSLVLLGLGTRAAAFISSGAMAYAYFKVHQPSALWPMENNGEGAAMYCWAFFLLIFTGSGAFGLDQLFAKRSEAARDQAPNKTPVTA
ncbi:DoxX family protein [Streptomyces resistomycificus]|uniref:DoxX family protein n=1 Tax=Streptomyces resistomycificus TaxID=67356 RepID=A0A0L8L4W2_9ACTN|nr:DoxX family protein [Streptomyces resistomycificus]KOG33258.1 DoxX family protein [Streptomyces resistomycificus]KUN99453.1 DoxX family protein [Streptomyces resistomycificus]